MANIDDVFIVTSKDYHYIVEGQINQIGYNFNKENFISEPKAMNTLPAIASRMLSFEDNEVCLVMPSEHVILNENYFIEQVQNSLDLSQSYLITFGIKPNSPKTVYGYIEKGNAINNGFVVTEAIKNCAEGKLEKADHYLNQKLTAYVLSETYKDHKKVEITIPKKYFTMRTEVADEYLYAAIDKAIDELERQIRNNKNKMQRSKKKKDF